MFVWLGGKSSCQSLQDHYSTLGVAADASQAEITTAYRRVAGPISGPVTKTPLEVHEATNKISSKQQALTRASDTTPDRSFRP